MPPDSPRPDFPGTRRFELIRVLGTGGMGVVYEALDRERQIRVALKTLRTLDAEAWLRLKNEFRSLQDIQHPNLVSLGELLEDGGQLFFTMELVRGVDFCEYVRPRRQSDASDLQHISTHTSREEITAGPASSMMRSRPATQSIPLRARRGGPTFDEGRLRSAFGQLARGLRALHSARKVHRDIKPSNVLVTEDGRVIILDFGLVTDLRRRADASDGKSIVGTAHFMAPEQAAAKVVGPEADWYSAGVMMYLALTGAYPFQLAPEVALDFKQRVEPEPPSLLVEGLPPDLEALCVDLLRLEPRSRPTGRQILRRLDLPVDDDNNPLFTTDFVGRRRELAILHDVFAVSQKAAISMLVEGDSGVGKSALARRFLEQIGGRALVFAGRCYERESVPYKAVDELVDAVSRHLSVLPLHEAEALMPSDVTLLAGVFPVLRRIPAVVSAPRPQRGVVEPLELRTLVFASLRELFRRLAARAPLILAIDDLQWADADSVALLTEILRQPGAPALLLLGTLRTTPSARAEPTTPGSPWAELFHDVRSAAASRGTSPGGDSALRLFQPGEVRRLVLGSLPPEEAQELATVLLRASLREGSSRPPPLLASEPEKAGDDRISWTDRLLPVGSTQLSAAAVAEEAGGMPLFIDALVRHRLVHGRSSGPLRLDEVLWSRVARLDPAARLVVEMVAVAGRPLLRDAAARASSVEGGELTRLFALLRSAHLIRSGGSGREEFIEPFHDRVRETVMNQLEPEVKRAWHRRLALALEASDRSEMEVLAHHWYEAGEVDRAANYAAKAGDQASAALAFGRAARLYRMAIDLDPRDGEEGRALLTKLADALGNAGHGAEAAEVYLAATYGAEPAESFDLERRAAENLLRSGYVSEGLGGLRAVLDRLDIELPRSPRASFESLRARARTLRDRSLAFDERPVADVPARLLAEIDACWSASLGLAMVDPVCGADFQARSLLASLETGDPYRIARSLALWAGCVGASGDAVAAADFLDAAEDVALRTCHPHALGLVQAVRGLTLFTGGCFRDAVEALDRAEVIFRERCTGVPWERGSVLAFAVFSLWFLGDLREFSRRVPLYLREADERGDRYLAANLRSGLANVHWLVADDPAAAHHETVDALAHWSTAGYHVQHAFDLYAHSQIALYEGDGESAHQQIVQGWGALSASLALRVQFIRIPLLELRARAAVAWAVRQSGAARERLLRSAERVARRIAAERLGWVEPLLALLRAGIAAVRGDRSRSLVEIEHAIHGFRLAEMALLEQVARRRRGELVGGAAGEAECAAADRWMMEQGVVNPVRLTATLAPGFPVEGPTVDRVQGSAVP